MANILQNISQKRENKKITLADIRHATALAYLTAYPATTMFKKTNGYEFAHLPYLWIHIVQGLENGNASCIYSICVVNRVNSEGPTSPNNITLNAGIKSTYSNYNQLKYLTNAAPSAILPSLKINPNEQKVIIEAKFWHNSNTADLNGNTNIPAKKAFGLFLVNPKSVNNSNVNWFNSIAIFTPKPGLFDETPPS